MNKIFSLIKYSSINQIIAGKNSSGKSRIGTISLWLFTGIILLVGAVIIFSETLGQLIQLGMPTEIFLISTLMIISGSIVFFDVIRAPGTIFNVKDFQLLATLPISGGKIILAKMLELLLSNYFLTIAIMIPAYSVYFSKVPFNGELLILLIISAIFVPFIPTAIGILIGYILYGISSKFKRKEFAITMAYFLGVILILLIVYAAPKYMPYLISNIEYIIAIISKIFIAFQFYNNIVFEVSYLNLLYFAILSMGIFFILAFVIKNTFFKLNSRFSVHESRKTLVVKEGKKQSKVISLLKTELIKYFSKGVVVVNTGVSGVIYVIYMLLIQFEIMNFSGQAGFNGLLILGALIFAMSPTTATSISLEGKAFNMKKALPIRAKDVLISKILVNIIVNSPFVLIGALVQLFIGKESINLVLQTMVVVLLAILAGSLFGMVINLKFYNFNWTSEAQVVKRGSSVIATMAPNMFIMFILMTMMNSEINIFNIIMVIYSTIFLVSLGILIKYGEKWYSEIQ